MITKVINEKEKFANLTSNLKLIGKEFNDEDYKIAIRRAVLDLTARTLKPRPNVGGKLVEKLIDTEDENSFLNQIKRYFDGSALPQNEFDEWHNNRCREILSKIQDYYTNADGTDVCYGKAQKIVNITMKGCYCFNGADQKEEHFKHCHMALDSFTLAWYNRNQSKDNRMKTKWSNLGENEYKRVVIGIREMRDPVFADLTPLQKEFLIWPLEIMISTVKQVNDCFGGLVDGDHVIEYFNEYGLANDLTMAKIVLGIESPDALEEDFVRWLNSIPKKQNKSDSAAFLLRKFGYTQDEV